MVRLNPIIVLKEHMNQPNTLGFIYLDPIHGPTQIVYIGLG